MYCVDVIGLWMTPDDKEKIGMTKEDDFFGSSLIKFSIHLKHNMSFIFDKGEICIHIITCFTEKKK